MKGKHFDPEGETRGERKAASRKKKIVIIVLTMAALAVILAVLFTSFRKNAKTVTEYLDLGENYMDELNYEEAVVAFQEAIRLEPKNTDASLGLGRAYEGAEEYEQAEAAYLSAIDKVSDCGDLYEALAELYIRLDRLEDAEALLEEAISQTDDEDVLELYEKTQPQPPTASLASGTYDTWQRLELSSMYSSEIIYYTTDGSEPGEDSSVYQEPIILSAGKTVIQAKVVNDRGYESEVAAYEYTIDREAQEITFEDEVMERAVRTKLNIWNTPITDEDTAAIQSLTIVGNYFEDSEESLAGTDFTEEGYEIYGSVHAETGDMQSLADLQYIPFLTELNIAYQENLSLAGIEVCTELRELSLLNDGLSSIGELQSLSSLERLSFGWNRVSDLTPLAGLSGLTSLSFWGNRVSDLAPLAGLGNLSYLDFAKNQVSDISALSGMTELSALWMYGNQVSDLTPLVELANLEVLMFRDNPVADLSVFQSIYPRLTRTDVSRKGGEGL